MHLKEFVHSLKNPSKQIRVYDIDSQEIYRGQQAYLKQDKLLDADYIVKGFDARVDFHRYLPGDRHGEKKDITEQNAGSYELRDITIRHYIEIFVQKEKKHEH